VKISRIAALLAVCLFAGDCLGDTVTLKNGHAINGVIVREAESEIVLNVGCGTVTFSRADIEAIEKSEGPANELIKEGWKGEYFDAFPAPTPEDQEILDAFKEIRNENARLAKRIAARDNMTLETGMLQRDLARLQDDRDEIGGGIKETDPEAQTLDYNELIVDFNSKASEMRKIVEKVNELREEKEAVNRELAGHITRLSNFKAAFNAKFQEIEKDSQDPRRKAFYGNLKERLASLDEDLERHEVEFAEHRQGIVVTADINGKQTARLLVDTGASLTVISCAIATGLGIDTDELKQSITLVLADGSTTSAKFILLDSVSVGEVKAPNVSAAVIEEAPSPGVDGLLGMSFLNNFSFSIDAEKQKLIFSSFK